MLRFFREYFFIFIIPALVLVYSFLLKSAAGPYWLSTNLDPSYQYLLNGLYMVKGISPGHIDHPGTPLQVLIWAVIVLFNIGHAVPDIVNRVLIDPEFYLQIAHAVLTLMVFMTSVRLAVYVYQSTRDRVAALLIQLPVLGFLVLKSYDSTDAVLPVVANVTPESLLICITNLFALCLLGLYFAKTPREQNRAMLFLGFIGGLGVATKINFFPLLAVPLFVLPWRKKGIFMVIGAGSFVLWTLPIIPRYPLFWKWVADLTTHLGNYGSGARGIVDLGLYFMNWRGLILQQGFFVIGALTGLIFSGWVYWTKKADKGSTFFVGTAMGVVLQFALVAKHPGTHYLLPGLGLCGVLFLFFYFHFLPSAAGFKKAVFVVVLICVFAGIARASVYRTQLAGLTADISAFHEHVRAKYKDYLFLGYYRSSGKEMALAFGDGWRKPHGVEDELSVLYPRFFFFDIFSYRIMNFKERVWSNDLLGQASGICFEGPEFDFSDGPYEVRLLEKGTHENIYQLTNTAEKQAEALFMAAAHSFEAKDYPRALSLALLARQFHHQPKAEVQNLIYVTAYLVKKGTL